MTPEEFAEVGRLFDAVLDLPEAERQAFIDANAPEGTPVRAELLGILAGQADSQFLPVTKAIEAVRSQAAPDELPPDTQIGNYRILKTLDGGGMGIVYLAVRNDDVFRKTVALKVIRQGVASKEFIERFRRERQILAGLDHQNIARILDGGDTPDGRPFYVMEFVDGQNIEEHCRRRSADVAARVRLVIEVCQAVEYLHEHAIVHRDIKPGNVLVNGEGHVKLLDFGIAGVQTADGLFDSPSAGKRTLLLTPGFASPEQLEGHSATKTSDIYAIGVLLYQLLSGKLPFLNEKGEPDLLKQLADEDPTPPSAIPDATGKTRTRVFPDLDRVVLAAMRRDPARRYATVKALREDLQRVLDGRPVTAHADTLFYRVGKAVRRNKIATALAIALVLALLTGGYYVVRKVVADRDLQAKEAQFERVFAALRREVERWNDPNVTPEHKLEIVRQTVELLKEPTFKQAAANGTRPRLVTHVLEGVEGILARAEQVAGSAPAVHKEIYRGFVVVGDFRIAVLQTSGGDKEAAAKSYERAAKTAQALKSVDEYWAREMLRQLLEHLRALEISLPVMGESAVIPDTRPPSADVPALPAAAPRHVPSGPTGPPPAASLDVERQQRLRQRQERASDDAQRLAEAARTNREFAVSDAARELLTVTNFLERSLAEINAGQLDDAEENLQRVETILRRARIGLGK